ncbi:MAG TPA: NUDIX hydrolase [Candidatus Hydrogenedentes bacterium]|nr:NUDIX hydrolase [Candidatus Hydrogenedentota bacterium]HQE82060.1 NUDIX hydrolase [Candidatus Hydrogenedentota bacterium]HQH53319.1 NUDIX hydrolase [Candidatus Hydrogenedentota bacterium]HQM47151.1 NUDIX hydrolase [Candidatus Hydrogenedentota bacterium]
MEQWTESKRIYQGRIFNVRAGAARLADGAIAPREVVEHPGGVGIVPFLGDRVALIRQYRIAVDDTVLEIPAGKLEPGEDPVARAHKELTEETGYTAGRLVPVGAIYASVGYTSEKIHLFLAFDLEHVGQKLEFDERIELAEFAVEELRQQLRNHTIEDAKTAIALQRLFDYMDGGAAG